MPIKKPTVLCVNINKIRLLSVHCMQLKSFITSIRLHTLSNHTCRKFGLWSSASSQPYILHGSGPSILNFNFSQVFYKILKKFSPWSSTKTRPTRFWKEDPLRKGSLIPLISTKHFLLILISVTISIPLYLSLISILYIVSSFPYATISSQIRKQS